MYEINTPNPSQELYVRTLAAAWRSFQQLYDPSVWLSRDPEIEEKMLRDPHISHGITQRAGMVAGKNWSLVALDPDEPCSGMAVEIGKSLLKNIGQFTNARVNLARAFFSGARFARIHGQFITARYGDGKPRRWWVPKRLEDFDKRMFRIVPERNGDVITAHWERFDLGKVGWVPETRDDARRTIRHVYQDDQSTLGHGRGLREVLAWCWFAKTNIFADSMAGAGRFARGITRIKIDGARDAGTGLPNETLIQAWVKIASEMIEEHGVVVLDSEDQIEFTQSDGTGWQLMDGIRAELKSTIATLLLGSNLPSSADSGGSYALAEVQENSTEALVQLDRESLEECLTNKLLGACWFYNFANLRTLGVCDHQPLFSLTQEKIQEPKDRAGVAEILLRNGLPISQQELYEQTGFSRPAEGEPVLTAPAPPVPSLGGFGGGNGPFA